MSEFRPRVPVAAEPRARRTALWIVAPLVLLAAVGLLLSNGDDPPDAADSATMKATRVDSGAGAVVTRSRISDLPPPDPYEPDPAGKALLQELTLPPVRARSGGTGYIVTKADAELLSHTALREGDLLLEIDGQKLDPSRLADELGEYDDVWVVFERDGKKQEMLLELRRR
jgi:hypothetical protein